MKAKKKVPRSTAKLSTLDGFLEEEGKREEFEAVAVEEVAWQIAEAMRHSNLSRKRLAEKMKPAAVRSGGCSIPRTAM